MKNACLLINLSLLINVFANVFMISLCKAVIATIKSQSSDPILQSQPLTFSRNSLLSVPTTFSRKTLIASCLSLRSQAFSWKSLVATPQSQAFSPKLFFATLQSQLVCCNLLLATTLPQPFSLKYLEAFSCNTLVPNLQFQFFGFNPSVAMCLSLQSQTLIPQPLVPSLHLQLVSVVTLFTFSPKPSVVTIQS